MPIDVQPDRVTLHHPAGSSTTVLLYGATVISWRSPAHTPAPSSVPASADADAAGIAPLGAASASLSPSPAAPTERLFVSALASLDGSKPVRGGIPICWPIFGPPSAAVPQYASLKQHGFARSTVWAFESTVLNSPEGVSARFVLVPTAANGLASTFPHPFKLIYTVTLAAHQLTTSLRVLNPAPPGSAGEPLAFQALLHNYFRGEASVARIGPLKGVEYVDKVRGGERATEEREVVDVREYIDRVYESAPGAYTLSFPPSAHLSLKTHNLPDVTVWNPAAVAGAQMADMEPGGWERYVCVEPGKVAEFVRLGAGEEWWGQQSITVL